MQDAHLRLLNVADVTQVRDPKSYYDSAIRSVVASSGRRRFDRRGANELDERFAIRLNRMSGQLERIERNSQIVIESLALFIRYELMVTPPLAENDQAGKALGAKRFTAFAEQVARSLTSGKRSFLADEE